MYVCESFYDFVRIIFHDHIRCLEMVVVKSTLMAHERVEVFTLLVNWFIEMT